MAGKIIAVALIGLFCLIVFFGCQALQRSALFYPSHHASDNGLARWMNEGALIGFAREVPQPENIWLMLHGNGGQAADRVYALGAFSPGDSVFILEYPGYGQRPGTPSRKSFDAAALEAYQLLRASFPANRFVSPPSPSAADLPPCSARRSRRPTSWCSSCRSTT